MTHLLFETLSGRTALAYLAVFVVPLALPVAFVRLVGLGGLRGVLTYEARDSLIHRLDPRIKLLYPFLVSTTSVILNWQAVMALLIVTLLPWALLRPAPNRVWVLLTLALAPAITVSWSQALFHPAVSGVGLPLVNFAFPPTISWLGTSGISLSGLVYGAEQSVRLLVSISSSLLLVLTTNPSDMVWAFRKFRLPAKAGFALAAALRFLPDLFTRLTVLLRAVEVRGLDLSRPGWFRPWQWPGYLGRVFICVPTVTVPLLIGSLRSTGMMAMVADARAFGAFPTPTTLKVHQTRRADIIAGAVLAAVVVAGVTVALTGVGGRTSYN